MTTRRLSQSEIDPSPLNSTSARSSAMNLRIAPSSVSSRIKVNLREL
ncbi:MAG: hypothetical protein HY321_16610 [Armatimonadetes bacterium]|nr:hypothetical protein [Armatimonadota bacterium]